MSAPPLLSVNQLCRQYGQRRVVDGISLQLDKGDVLAFLGPNGAGKTTTLQMLCGVLAPSAGQVHINGYDVWREPGAAKRHLGYLPDTPPLYPELTVDEYLAFCARLHQVPRRLVPDAVATAKERCGLQQVGKRLLGNLSKGYQQRVGIAQALVHEPPLLVLDEPTVGLDPLQIVEIRNLIKELGNNHGVILSTHLLSEAQQCCNRILIISEGRTLLEQGAADAQQNLEALFVSLLQPETVPH